MNNVISVIVPVYGSPESLKELCTRLNQTLLNLTNNFEIILVNDGCPYNSWGEIEQIVKTQENIIGVKLSKNYGQHKAIHAGIKQSNGDWVVVMDCDLQDAPEDIALLYNKSKEGNNIVLGQRLNRQDSTFKIWKAKMFYAFFNFFSGLDSDSTVGNFSIISRKVANAYLNFREQDVDYTNIIHWLGFEAVKIEVNHAERKYGESSYTFGKLLNLAVNLIISESNKPLRFSVKFGFFVSFLSLLYGLNLIAKKVLYGVSIEGWTSVIVSIYFIGGLIFANLGILGLYIGKIYDENKARPRSVVQEILRSDKD